MKWTKKEATAEQRVRLAGDLREAARLIKRHAVVRDGVDVVPIKISKAGTIHKWAEAMISMASDVDEE